MSKPQIDYIGLALAYALDGVLWARDVLGLDLDDWQADVIRATGAQLLRVTRQGGKTRTVAVKALHHLLHIPEAMIVAASPSEEQSKELFRRLTGFYDRVHFARRPKSPHRQYEQDFRVRGARSARSLYWRLRSCWCPIFLCHAVTAVRMREPGYLDALRCRITASRLSRDVTDHRHVLRRRDPSPSRPEASPPIGAQPDRRLRGIEVR
jgi:hypothetical protein